LSENGSTPITGAQDVKKLLLVESLQIFTLRLDPCYDSSTTGQMSIHFFIHPTEQENQFLKWRKENWSIKTKRCM